MYIQMFIFDRGRGGEGEVRLHHLPSFLSSHPEQNIVQLKYESEKLT